MILTSQPPGNCGLARSAGAFSGSVLVSSVLQCSVMLDALSGCPGAEDPALGVSKSRLCFFQENVAPRVLGTCLKALATCLLSDQS